MARNRQAKGFLMIEPARKMRYRLGIDVGVASLGIAIVELGNSTKPSHGDFPTHIVGGSVRTWPIPEGAAERRQKRGMRRNIGGGKRRLDRLSDLLAKNGIGYSRKDVPKELLIKSPIKLRAKGSRGKIELDELARALLHIARHRGSSAIREQENTEQNDDKGKKKKRETPTADAIKSLRGEMTKRGFSTYGQYLRWREKKNYPIRINQTKMANGKDGYAFYPSRQMLVVEFNAIWDEQTKYYPDALTDTLKVRVEDELFFQRAVTSPPPGKCPYFTDEHRLPRASRLFQIRRIYEEANHLRFHNRNGEAIHYGLEQRDMIATRLLSGEDLSFAGIKNTIGLKRTDKVSLESTKTRKGIDGFPFDIALGHEDFLGETWLQADEARQDDILQILATEHDDQRAIEKLLYILNGDEEMAKRALQAPLPKGWGNMGLTATVRILEELKRDVVPARVAEDKAGLFHAATPDGVIYNRLPYYGEVLPGHTVDPIWVSNYRRDTDRPPATNPLEKKFGRIPNPVVHLALNQIRQTVNAVIEKYGLPEDIHIELARDLNKSAEAREEIAKSNAENQKENDNIREILEHHNVTVHRTNLQKYKLWQEQGCVCIYTNEPISLKRLYFEDVEVDHILPRSKTYSDSMTNKVVCTRASNADKKNRPPFEAFTDDSNYDWDAIMRRVEKLRDNKQWRFTKDAMKNFEDGQESFRARYGTDNSYIARVTRQYLTCLYGEPTRVIAVSSHIVGLLRGKWGLLKILGEKASGKKARDDHRHHFIDALVTACATRSMVQRIQTEAARCEREGLEAFVKTINPPFGDGKMFFNAAKEATLDRVTLSRKADHSIAGQMHEDTLRGIIDGPDKAGKYTCRVRRKLKDYATLAALEKPTFKTTLPDLPEIASAREALDELKASVRRHIQAATKELEEERAADIEAGKKGKKVSDRTVFARAVKLHMDADGRSTFTLYENMNLVNLRRSKNGNRLTGGYVGGRNHRMDFYLDGSGKVQWQCISMMDANDPRFEPEASKEGCKLLWSAHKEDVLLMDNPDKPDERIRVTVGKFRDITTGVVPECDARDSKKRVMWEKGLSFFYKAGAQRVILDPLGDISWHFPALPHSGKAEADA